MFPTRFECIFRVTNRNIEFDNKELVLHSDECSFGRIELPYIATLHSKTVKIFKASSPLETSGEDVCAIEEVTIGQFSEFSNSENIEIKTFDVTSNGEKFYIFSTRFECSYTSPPLVSSVDFSSFHSFGV